jgi:hypothetical protein
MDSPNYNTPAINGIIIARGAIFIFTSEVKPSFIIKGSDTLKNS